MAAHGRYTIVGKLADGGMAEIFLAVQHGAEGFEKQVVLKRILTAFSVDAQFRNMFIDEAHISMTLSHGNIVQVQDLGVANGRYFLVLELVDGWDLDRIIKRARAAGMVWPTALSLYVAAEVCRALAFAHNKTRQGKPLGIVHRDVSPNNVLISEQGEVKLADFGIAKAQQKREQTAAGVIKGKVAFMSPEQATGGALDRRSDLFSVGSMLYLMVTDRLPFEAPTDLETLLRVQRAEMIPPQDAKATVGDGVTRIIMRAMRRVPGERYQSADEMLADIERILRSDFQSAGQSELKAWLEQLARRDGATTIAKNAHVVASESGVPGDVVGTDLSVGTSFELGDLDAASGATEVSGSSSTPVRTPGPTRDIGVRGIVPVPMTPPLGAPQPPPRSRRLAGFWWGALFAIGALFAVRTVSSWVKEQTWFRAQPAATTPDSEIATKSSEPSAGTATDDRVPSPSATTAAGTAPTDAIPPAPGSAGEPPPPGGPGGEDTAPSPPAGAPATVATPDDEPDEEALLRGAEPDVANAVIGEDEAEPASARARSPAATTKPKAEPARTASRPTPAKGAASPASAAPVTIALHITSKPDGAIVRTKQRVLGRTPINLRFRTGSSYELTFLKKGYTTTTRKVTVSGKKNRSLSVSMKKQGKRSYSIFRPSR